MFCIGVSLLESNVVLRSIKRYEPFEHVRGWPSFVYIREYLIRRDVARLKQRSRKAPWIKQYLHTEEGELEHPDRIISLNSNSN